MSMNETLNEKIIPAVMKFVNLKPVTALKDGILYTLPLTLVGSVFLLLAQLPIPALNEWIASIFGAGWTEPLFQAYNATFKLIALVATVGIAYCYAKNDEHEPLSAGIMAFVVFILTSNLFITSATGEVVSGVIPMTWTGGEGMVAAIIIGLLVGITYSWFMAKKITIKMPDGVPQGVANAFSSLIPAAVIIVFSTFVFGFFKYVMSTTFIEFIYKVIQTPLQGLSDSLPGAIAIAFLIPFLWWFGVHGSTIVSGVTQGILLSNTTANQAILDSGKELTVANGAHIVTQQFLDQLINITGAGVTIGLVICMLFFAKSTQSKQLGKLAFGPGMFNINEPVTFGTPIVMNPFMAIPFILTPVVSAILAYFAIATGLVHPFSGILVPWTTPPVISGFILGGWRTAAMQVVSITLSVLIYLPFFKKQDTLNYKDELDAQKAA
jgi:PTS system cellobiose-specific IIC component